MPVWLLIGGLFLCVQPWWSLPGLYPYDHQRWIEILTLALMGVAVSVQTGMTPGRWVCRHPGLAWTALVTVMLMVASTVMSSVGWVSWASLMRTLFWAVVLATLPGCYRRCTDRERGSLTLATLLVLSIYSFYASLGVFVLLVHGLDQRSSMVPGFSNINHAAGFLLLAFLIMPALQKRLGDNAPALRWLGLASGSGLAFLLMVIGARGPALAGVAALAVLWVLCAGTVAREYGYACLKLLLGGGLLFALARSWVWWLGVGAAPPGTAPAFDGGRLLLYQQALAGFMDAPWLGHGPLSFAARTDSPVAHPHNIVLSALYEYGLPFTAAVSALVLSLAVRLFRYRTAVAGSHDGLAGVAVVCAFAVHSQLSGVAMIPATMMVLALGGMMSFQILDDGPVVAAIKPVPGKRALRIWMVLICAGALLISSIAYWSALDGHAAQKPRFWLNGGTAQWRS